MNKLLFAVATVAISISVSGSIVNAEEYTLRYSQHHSSQSAPYTEVTVPVKEFIERESGGRIKVETFPNGVLHGGKDGFKALVTDVTDIAPAFPLYLPSSFHLTNGMFLPGAFDSVHATIEAGEVLYPKYLKPEYQAMGIELFFTAASAPYQLVSTKKIDSLEDLKGMKVRGSGGAVNQMVESLGATPVTIPSAEIYSAFQQGLIDGVLVPTESILTFRLQEIAKYYVPLDLGRAGHIPFGLNRKTYMSLPDDLRKVVYDAGRYASLKYADFNQKGIDNALEAMKEAGVVTIVFSDEDKEKIAAAQKVLWDEFIAKNEADGYPAKEFVAEMQALSAKYGDMRHDEMVEEQKTNPVKGVLPDM